MGVDLTGGPADIHKCLDQFCRPLVYKIPEEAGMPKQALDKYKQTVEGLTVYNTVAGGLGEDYTKPASIPQGDPFSMLVVAVFLRPWIEQMKT